MSNVISRNKFSQIKQFLHLADNNALEKGNKVSKVTPLYDIFRKNIQSFGIFQSTLSIDESMCPYYGKHSCKMFIRMKPIRFGFKLWVLAGKYKYCYLSRCDCADIIKIHSENCESVI